MAWNCTSLNKNENMPTPRNADIDNQATPSGVQTRSQTRKREENRRISRTPRRENRAASFPGTPARPRQTVRTQSADGTSTTTSTSQVEQQAHPVHKFRQVEAKQIDETLQKFAILKHKVRDETKETRSLKETIDRLRKFASSKPTLRESPGIQESSGSELSNSEETPTPRTASLPQQYTSTPLSTFVRDAGASTARQLQVSYRQNKTDIQEPLHHYSLLQASQHFLSPELDWDTESEGSTEGFNRKIPTPNSTLIHNLPKSDKQPISTTPLADKSDPFSTRDTAIDIDGIESNYEPVVTRPEAFASESKIVTPYTGTSHPFPNFNDTRSTSHRSNYVTDIKTNGDEFQTAAKTPHSNSPSFTSPRPKPDHTFLENRPAERAGTRSLTVPSKVIKQESIPPVTLTDINTLTSHTQERENIKSKTSGDHTNLKGILTDSTTRSRSRPTKRHRVHFHPMTGIKQEKMDGEGAALHFRHNSSSSDDDSDMETSWMSGSMDGTLQKVSLPNSVSPDHFKGTEKEDARIWWTNFCKFAALKGWKDNETLVTLPLFFRDAAAIWFDSLEANKKDTLQKLYKAFSKRYFLDDSLKWVLLEKFNTRTQKEDESATDYAQVMIKLGRDLKKTQKETMEGIVRGLKSHIRYYVIEHDPKSLDDAIHHAKVAEAFRKETNSKTDEGIAELTKQVSALQAQLKNELGAIKVAAIATKYEPNNPQAGKPYQQHPQRGPFLREGGPYQTTVHNSQNATSQWQRPTRYQQETPTPYFQRYRPCRSCGSTSHDRANCRFASYQCLKCNRIGHLKRVCMSGLNNTNDK